MVLTSNEACFQGVEVSVHGCLDGRLYGCLYNLDAFLCSLDAFLHGIISSLILRIFASILITPSRLLNKMDIP